MQIQGFGKKKCCQQGNVQDLLKDYALTIYVPSLNPPLVLFTLNKF